MSDWGKAIVNNIDWGQAATNNINWGSVYADSPSGDTALKTSGFANVYSLDFDGVDDYVESGSSLSLSGDFTASAWIKPTVFRATWNMIFGFDASAGDSFIAIRGSNGILSYSDGTLDIQTPNFFVTENVWQNIVVKREGATVTFYNNTSKYIDAQSSTGRDNSGVLSIGRWTGSSAFKFEGFIDETAIWDTALTDAQITDIYNSGLPNDLSSLSPLLWYRFEEGSGTTATDSGSGGNDGTLTNGVAYSTDVPPTFNKFALSFDGVDDFVSMGNVLNMANDGTDAFSVSFWMKRNSFSFEMIVSKQLNSGSYNGFGVYINSGKLNFLLGSLLSPSSSIQGKSTSSVVGSTWQNITLTYDGSQDISGFNIYINGVSDTIVQVSNNTPTNVANTTNFQLSGRDGTSLKYGGLLDEVGFWLGTELTSVQASAIYNSGNPASLSAYSPTSYWRFEEGSGTTATDSGSASNNGTLTNGVAYSTDKP